MSALEWWRTDPDIAGSLLDESIALVRAGANSVIYPIMLAIKGLLCAGTDDVIGACALFHEAVLVSSDKGDLPNVVTALDYSIQVLVAFGEAETAATISGAVAGDLSVLRSNPVYEIPHREGAFAEA